MSRFYSVLFLSVFTVGLSSCATPKLKSWSGKSFELCCKNNSCSDDTWREAEQKHCSGTVEVTGGDSSRRFKGISINRNAGLGTQIQTNEEVEVCRKYECSERVRP